MQPKSAFLEELKNNAPTLLAAAIGLYLIFSPVWAPSVAPRLYDNARALEICLLVLTSLTVLHPVLASGAIKLWNELPTLPRVCIALFLVGGAISAGLSGARHFGAMQMGLMAQLVLLFILTAVAVRTAGWKLQLVLLAAITTGAGLLVIKFWYAFVQSYVDGTTFSWVSPFLDFANVRFFGQYQSYALLLVGLPALLPNIGRSWRALALIVAANFWALQWMVGSRAVWVGFLAAVCVIAAFMRAGRMRWLAVQGAVVLAGGVLYLLIAHFVLATPNATPIPVTNSILERGEESSSERITLAKSALRMIAEHPLAGVGPGQFGLHYSATNAAHPHDTPLQLVAEYGVISGGAAVMLGLLLLVFAAAGVRRGTPGGADVTTASLGAALTMGLVDSLFSGNLVMPHSQVLFCVLAGCLVGRILPSDRAIRVSPRLAIEKTALLGIALLATLASVVLTIEYLALIRDMPYPPNLRIPSFWQYGRFVDW